MAAGWRPGNITDWGAIACIIVIIVIMNHLKLLLIVTTCRSVS